MAQLPAVQLDSPQAPAPPQEGIRPTDFGLNVAGEALDRAASIGYRASLIGERAQAAVDKQTVAPFVATLGGYNDQQLAQDAAGYTGQPGFAATQMDRANTRAYLVRQALATHGASPGELSEYDRAAQNETLRVGTAANQHAATVLAAPIAEQQANQRNQQVAGAVLAANAAFGPQYDALRNGYVTGAPDLAPQVGQAWDAAAADAVAKLPPDLQPFAQHELDDQRLRHQLDAQDFQVAHGDASILTTYQGQAGTLADSVLSSPSGYSNAATTLLPKLVSALPAGLQAAATREGMAALVDARMHGLIAAEQGDQAKTELNAGTYDAWLDPKAKQSLLADADAQARATGPEAIQRGVDSATLRDQMQANLYAIQTTGKPSLPPGAPSAAVSAKILSGEDAGAYQVQVADAQARFAAAGPVAGLSNPQLLAAAAEPVPQPGSPTYAQDLVAYQARQKAVDAETHARAGGAGAWMFGSTQTDSAGRPVGRVMSGMWTAATQAGPGQPAAMSAYARGMLETERATGFAPGQYQVVPQPTAAALAASVTQAPPEQRLQALTGLAGTLAATPGSLTLGDGSVVSPRALLAAQLGKAGLGPAPLAALDVYADNPAGLGHVAAALNDPELLKHAGDRGSAKDPLPGLVHGALAPYVATLPGGGAGDGTEQMVTLVARELMKSQGMDAGTAARTAAADLTGKYAFAGAWRMPAAIAATPVTVPGQSMLGLLPATVPAMRAVDVGTHAVLAQLTGANGAGLYAPASIAGTVADRQRIFASQVTQSGKWVTLPDDTGLALVIPKPDGRSVAVADRYGRPVTATWATLQGVAQGRPSPFAAPPANGLTVPAGPGAAAAGLERPAGAAPAAPAAAPAPQAAATPVRGFSRPEAADALSRSVEWHESRGVNGLVSRTGALGVMQLEPDTVRTWAPQLGLPIDMERARTDVAYNRTIGNAYLHHLVTKYMTGANPSAGLGLALAAYSAGEGRVDGYRDARGYHPGWLQTIGDPRTGTMSLDDWVSRIPGKGFAETRAYLQPTLAHAVGLLHAGGR